MNNEITAADVVNNIMSGNSMEAKSAFDSLVTARVGEMISQVRPDVAASLFSGEESSIDETDTNLDTEEGSVDGDQVQSVPE